MACPERLDTIVVGGGQAGLAVAYHLSRRGLPFVVLDAGDRAATRGGTGGIAATVQHTPLLPTRRHATARSAA